MEHFIKKVRYYPYLWDLNHTSYRDIGKKDLAWEIISRECGLANGQEAKIQWKKIRDSHREALRRRRTCIDRGAQNIGPWKYEAHMEFLLPQAQNKVTYSDPLKDTQDITDVHNTTVTNTNNATVSQTSPSKSPLQTPSTKEHKNRNQKQCCTKSVDKILQRRQQEIQRDILMNNTVDNDRIGTDALSNLFTSFCQKTRELPKYLQLRVQRQIFDTVTRAEEEALSIDSIDTCTTPTSSASLYGYTRATNYQTSLPDASTDTVPRPISISPKSEQEDESDSMSDISNGTQS